MDPSDQNGVAMWKRMKIGFSTAAKTSETILTRDW
jgi:hypothetical protein